ncbi:response regulator transcription factor [Bordetella sp. BOR01]|uniref:response regulator n=1 Tax=Bordetella sp. BOR01 TaxID=2854779 RepID=UPI001C467AE1|nr:response regulator transcription factor [Bordetella sp. BOR01]
MTTVLVVDDHPPLRLVVRQQLSQILGVGKIVEAGNGQDAVQLVREHMPGLVILDIELPRINGLEVIPRIKAIHPGVRILAVSAQDPSLFAPRVKAAGAQGYIGKVNEIPEIVRAIEVVLAGYTIFPDFGADAHAGAEIEATKKLERLSDKEIMVMQMLARGMSNKEIGDAMFISNKTVSTYKTRLMAKLGVVSLVDLVDFTRRHHISL